MSSQQPPNQQPTPQQPVRLGIIGLGAIGASMLNAATGHPDAVLTIAADINREVLDRHRGSHPDVVFTTDPQQLLDFGELDAVYIGTPPATHKDLTLAALRRGLAVFCEKPLAIDLTEGAEMLAVAEASDLPCAVNFALSDRHAVLEIERALQAGDLGEVLSIEVKLGFSRWPRDFQSAAGWVAGRRQGGFIREVFSHFAYLTDRLLGPLRPVELSVEYPAHDADGAEVAAEGRLRVGDVPVTVTGSVGPGNPEQEYEWIIAGTKRSYRLSGWDQLHVSEKGNWQRVELSAERGADATRLSRFARAVRGEPVDHLADFSTAYRVQQVVESFHSR